MKKYSILLVSLFIFSCTNKNEGSNLNSEHAFIELNNKAHHFDQFKNAGILSADIQLFFGGKERLNAQILFNTQTEETALVHKDGRKLSFTDGRVWLSPDTTDYPSARFDIFTWSYFMTLPYKLNDAGVNFEEVSYNELMGKKFTTHKMSFDDNVGDAPDDWYVLYHDKNSGLLSTAAYIVTLNKSVEEGEKDPHAIVYEDYKTINNIPVSHSWKFYGWTQKEGLTKELGKATLSNVKFINSEDFNFQLEANRKEVLAPN